LPILAACDYGKAVYTAAAMDLVDTAEARQLKERVEKSGVAFTAEFPRRIAPATIRLKELIATRLGQPKLLFCHRRSRFPVGSPTPKTIRHSPTMTRELMEQVDWCRYVVGHEPNSVIGVGHLHQPDESAEDYHMLSLCFSPKDNLGTGPIAQISSSRYMSAAWQEAITFRPPAELQVACERGIAFIDLPSQLIWFDDAGRHLEPLDDERPIGERLLMQFYRSVTSLVRRADDLDDTYQALRVVIAAQSSFVQGRRVFLEEVQG
jgi:predicted dehydrogenase